MLKQIDYVSFSPGDFLKFAVVDETTTTTANKQTKLRDVDYN